MDLNYRDAFADHAAVPSDLVATLGHDVDQPLVTIAIPTYRRPEYLTKVVQSVLDQRFDRPVEIIIVDNDDDAARSQAILDSLPRNPPRPIRYYRNASNIGMFGNWNRCIELARGEWVTILNDDDLLRPEFLEQSFRTLDRRGDIDGLVCRKLSYDWNTGRVREPGWREAIKWLAFRWRFDLHDLTQAVPRKLFFGNELDNGCGFLFRKSVGVAMGGYREEEFPASDFFFYIRFCVRYKLFWTNKVLAYIGVGENESMRMATIYKSIALAADYYDTMTKNFVPREWIKLRPQLTANQVLAYRQKFGVNFASEDIKRIEDDIGGPLPPPSYGKIRRFRLLHGGY